MHASPMGMRHNQSGQIAGQLPQELAPHPDRWPATRAAAAARLARPLGRRSLGGHLAPPAGSWAVHRSLLAPTAVRAAAAVLQQARRRNRSCLSNPASSLDAWKFLVSSAFHGVWSRARTSVATPRPLACPPARAPPSRLPQRPWAWGLAVPASGLLRRSAGRLAALAAAARGRRLCRLHPRAPCTGYRDVSLRPSSSSAVVHSPAFCALATWHHLETDRRPGTNRPPPHRLCTRSAGTHPEAHAARQAPARRSAMGGRGAERPAAGRPAAGGERGGGGCRIGGAA